MEQLNLTRAQIIEEFNKGKVIRKTSGIWNFPTRDGRIVNNIEELNRFYDWAAHVDVYKGWSEGIDYDLRGASECDMF